MTSIHPWVLGLAAKPEGITYAPAKVVHDKVYPPHKHSTEIDPTEHQCANCGARTDLFCEGCDALTCEDCYGSASTPDGPIERNYCISCMDDYMHGG